ncbi:ATP-binding protein [Aeromonas veronii]|uniref:ATP-binding protein n=1 Tax=Aeromonas veronii TaxID=654 RepID=UPI000954263F|nr:sensor histidine kinase [Aeromonas veronii]SIQ38417.1 Histidine kinase-, DNA gyrase B-, and HSP90-like ATPase [Aeromonas veronii]
MTNITSIERIDDDSPFKIRPSARIIQTIGRDLVKDKYAAVVELVKNAYDADSLFAKVVFKYSDVDQTLSILVSDEGDGMSADTVINKWLVPATSDKLKRRVSKKGRALQGRKGIGRFAATALGDAIFLSTKNEGDKEISLLLDMHDFTDDRLLEDVPIVIEQKTNTDIPSGTKIEIITRAISPKRVEELWGENSRNRLALELSKLLAPNEISKQSNELGYSNSEDNFTIHLGYQNMPGVEDEEINIESVKIIDLFDYRIHGTIDEKGNAVYYYTNQNIPFIPPEALQEKIIFSSPNEFSYPGKVAFDIRVFDRDREQLEELIARGLKDPFSGKSVTPAKAKEILDEYYGVSLFRGNFRIRPYGDKDYDWLERDKRRVNNPSLRVGHNQLIGFVNIQPEELSSLEEKSARDGLVENSYYEGLKYIINTILTQLEQRRFTYREKVLLGRSKSGSLDEKIEDLFNFDGVVKRIEKHISNLGIEKTTQKSISQLVGDEISREQKTKAEQYRKVKETLALYQGQATLGKITHIVLHEGRKHIKVFNEVPPRLSKWLKVITNDSSGDLIEKIESRSSMLVKSSQALSHLFKKIEPLAISRLPNRKSIQLVSELESTFNIFEGELSYKKVSINIYVPKDIKVYATSFDIATIFSNLIENSIYWLSFKEHDRKINVEVWDDSEQYVEILFNDNGPGFKGSNLELMFEPGYSTKQDSTASGLGLALVGESISRLEGNIRAVKSEDGASFILKFKKVNS